jgi:hypothetical protein
LSLPSRLCHWHIPLIISLVHNTPGRIPRTPLVIYQFNGKPFGTLRFTFNLLNHLLSIEPWCPVPLSLISTNLSWKGKSYSGHDSPCVACFLPTLRYGPSLPRGLLGGLGTSSSSTQVPCGLAPQSAVALS